MNIVKVVIGIVLLGAVGAVPLFWSSIISGAVLGHAFIPLALAAVAAIAGIIIIVRGISE